MITNMVLAIISLLILIDGFYIYFFPKQTKRLIKNLVRNSDLLRLFGIIELIIGLVLLGVSVLFWSL